jgi:hypothetical protein
MKSHPLIRKLYLYVVSGIGLMLVVIGCVQLVNLGLKVYVFKAADKYYAYPMSQPAPIASKGGESVVAQPSEEQLQAYQDNQTRSNRQSSASNAIAMIIVGAPLYAYHWYIIRRDKEEAES